MKPSFKHYSGLGWDLMRQAREEGNKLSAVEAITQGMATGLASAFIPSNNQAWAQSLLVIGGIEMAHYALGHKVVCINTDNAQAMAEQKNDVRLYDLQFPAPIFEISFPESAVLPNGMHLPSCLISLPSADRAREVARLLGRSMAKQAGMFAGSAGTAFNKIVEEQARILLEIAEKARPLEDSWFTTQIVNSIFVMYSLKQMVDGKEQELIGFIQMPAKEDGDVEDIIERLYSTSDESGKALDYDENMKILRTSMARIALNFIIYLNAGGMLEATKLHNRPKLGSVPPSVEQIPSTLVGWHWRRAHFRTLRAERYYRNQKYPPDRYRIVPVKNAVIMKQNAPAEPEANIIWPLSQQPTEHVD